MSRILVGSTIPAFAMQESDWGWWLSNADHISARAGEAGHQVDWLATLQVDARGPEPFTPLAERMTELSPSLDVRGHLFMVDVGVSRWDSGSRLLGIVTGRNMIIDHALRGGHDWIYSADSDIEAPNDILVKLLELEKPVVGAHVPTYCLDGPRVVDWQNYDVRQHWNTAGSLLVHRDVFRRVPWRHDPDTSCTDDPATQAEMERLGWPTYVRHDVVCRHHPEHVTPLENRGLDLEVRR